MSSPQPPDRAPTPLPREFARIARYFRPLAGPGALDLLDDAAVLAPPAGRELVIAADAMVGGVHFLPDDPPDLVARKLLRTNLSDLAAMGADPLGYLLTVSVPRATPDAWFAAFAGGLARDQEEFGLFLLGGDSTSTPGPVSLSLTILGTVAAGAAVRRVGARAGDLLCVTGTIGDGALGLLASRGELADADGTLRERYLLPRPRLGILRHDLVHAALDISDGLVQDVGHLCRAADCAARIDAAAIPLSAAARTAGAAYLPRILSGGDDYELAMAVAPDALAALRGVAGAVPITCIGRFLEGPAAVTVRAADGTPIPLDVGGWSHF
jgi:thiamine-monophosphate kinase